MGDKKGEWWDEIENGMRWERKKDLKEIVRKGRRKGETAWGAKDSKRISKITKEREKN